MLSRNLMATVIKTFFEELDNVRDGGERQGNASLYAGFYLSYFNREREWFLNAPVTEWTTFFADDPIYKLEMLAELLYRDARAMTDMDMQRVIHQKLLELYEVIDARSLEFSIERMNRAAEIRQRLEDTGKSCDPACP